MNFLLGTWWLWIIAEIIIVIVTVRIATRKNYSGGLAFLLCLCVPMFGALVIVALLPDNSAKTGAASEAPVNEESAVVEVDNSGLPVYSVKYEYNLRTTADASSLSDIILNKDAKVFFLEKDGFWTKIRTDSNKEGWVSSDVLQA